MWITSGLPVIRQQSTKPTKADCDCRLSVPDAP
jgi:hypothetical protein